MLVLGCQPSPTDLYDQGRVATEKGNFKQALHSFKEILKQPELSDKDRYKALFGESKVYKIQKKHDQRAQLLKKIIEDQSLKALSEGLKKDLADLYVMQADQAIGKSSSNEEVIALFRKAIALDPQSKARLKLARKLRDEGDVEFKEKRFDQALAFFTQAKELNVKDETFGKGLIQAMNQTKFADFLTGAEALFKVKRAKLEGEKKYDHQTKTLYLTVSTEIPGRVKRKNREELTQAGIKAIHPLAQQAVADLINELFQIKHSVQVDQRQLKEIEVSLAKRSKRVKMDKKRVWVTPISYRFAFPLTYAYKLAYRASR
jgi:tetratricopeptide (TPR) repeat protein